MDSILGDMHGTFVYLDDILVASATEEQHEEDLQEPKCILGASEVSFLGH
jgi:hypothetical protein